MEAGTGESLLLAAISNSNDIVVKLSEDMRVVGFNKSARYHLAGSLAEVVGADIEKVNNNLRVKIPEELLRNIDDDGYSMKSTLLDNRFLSIHIQWQVYILKQMHRCFKYVLYGSVECEYKTSNVAKSTQKEFENFFINIPENIPANVYWKDLESNMMLCNSRQSSELGYFSWLDAVGDLVGDQGVKEDPDMRHVYEVDKKVIKENRTIQIEEDKVLDNGEKITYLS